MNLLLGLPAIPPQTREYFIRMAKSRSPKCQNMDAFSVFLRQLDFDAFVDLFQTEVVKSEKNKTYFTWTMTMKWVWPCIEWHSMIVLAHSRQMPNL